MENGRDLKTVTVPGWNFEVKSNLISRSVVLDAQASVLRYLEDQYEEATSLPGDCWNTWNTIITSIVDDTLDTLRHSFNSELEQLGSRMKEECREIFSEQRMAEDQKSLDSLRDIAGNKRKLSDSNTLAGLLEAEKNDGLLHPPQKRPFGHRRSSSGSSIDTMLGSSPGSCSVPLSSPNGTRYSISQQVSDHSRTVVALATTVRPPAEFVCPYRKHSSLEKDHSHRTSCRGTFDGASKLRQHVRIAYRAYFCPVENCFARFPSTDERKGHIEPCKEKGPKASRDISSEVREAFTNAKVMMEKNVPLAQIQEIIDQLCNDDRCSCRNGNGNLPATPNPSPVLADADAESLSPEHPLHPDPDQNYITSTSAPTPTIQFQYDQQPTDLHDHSDSMLVDHHQHHQQQQHHPFTTNTSMSWTNPASNYQPRTTAGGGSLWSHVGLKTSTSLGETLPPIVIQDEDGGGVGVGFAGLGYHWGQSERATALGIGPDNYVAFSSMERG